MLNVGRLNEGVVLDHIEAGKSMSIYKYLKLDKILSGFAAGKILWLLFGVILTVILSTKFFEFPVANIQRSFLPAKSRKEIPSQKRSC